MNRSAYSPLLVLLALFIWSCADEALVFEQNVVFDNARWATSDRAVMEFEIEDTLSQHNFYLNVRNTESYPYRNLYVFVKTVFPNGKFSKDTVGVILADATGKWVGDGSGYLSSSQHLSNTIMYQYSKRFPLKGEYKVEIEQAMRVDTLEGIRNVGLRIERIPFAQ